MSATLSLRGSVTRRVDATLSFIQHCLITVALVVSLTLLKPFANAAVEAARAEVTDAPSVVEREVTPEPAKPPPEALPARLQRVLDHVSRRYRVAPEALVPVFEAAESVGRERRVDPLLIIAIIGIESRFNPFAESPFGAKGLMQVIPGYHLNKVPPGAGEQPFLDPVTNIQVGVHVLEEAIRWRGSLIAGLQHYGGAPDDPDTSYASKVLAEKQRLEQAAAARRGPGPRA